ncbi:MAG TPA: MEDS domain-containing protein [Nitrososphaera sp.]|nr:MEDS domain-containing protein [Nitrososphaera sp.]
MKNHTSSKNHKNMSPPSSASSSLVQEVRHSNFHDHNMLIYPDLTTYRKIYSESAQLALDNNETVLLITTYDSFDRIKDSLTEAGISVNNKIKEGSLAILDAVKAYQIDTYGAVKFVTTLARRAERDGKGGVFALTEMGSFFIAERIASLLEYERSLPKKWKLNNFKSVCTYHKGDFATLSKQQQETILSAHNRVLA